ncbi:MAG: hypothetical protein K9K67_14835 [Bacteriovoracaceae bacterium]|nr:hypothetical protein [Bacteriovoracaceae bacterium]
MFSKSLFLFFSFSFLAPSFAAEVDSFTRREIPLEDSLDLINKKSNEFMEKAINEANEAKGFCHQKTLYKSMRRYFNNQYRGELGKYIVEAKELDNNLVKIEESIYQDFSWSQSFIQGYWARKVNDPSAANLNVNGVIIGTDKFEHFMGSGYLYYRKNYLKGKGVREAMKIGYTAETGIMGAFTTGVKAFGDLSANFNGMRFWNHVLQNYDDVLGKEYNIGPYIACQGNKWVQVKEMNWADYIDHSFDEGLNCSAFPNKEMVELVQKRLSALEKKTGIEYNCPFNTEKIESVIPKYGEFAKDLINDLGHLSLKVED